jgi:hypothetical protein
MFCSLHRDTMCSSRLSIRPRISRTSAARRTPPPQVLLLNDDAPGVQEPDNRAKGAWVDDVIQGDYGEVVTAEELAKVLAVRGQEWAMAGDGFFSA